MLETWRFLHNWPDALPTNCKFYLKGTQQCTTKENILFEFSPPLFISFALCVKLFVAIFSHRRWGHGRQEASSHRIFFFVSFFSLYLPLSVQNQCSNTNFDWFMFINSRYVEWYKNHRLDFYTYFSVSVFCLLKTSFHVVFCATESAILLSLFVIDSELGCCTISFFIRIWKRKRKNLFQTENKND